MRDGEHCQGRATAVLALSPFLCGAGRELAELWGAHLRFLFDGMDLVKKTPQNLSSIQLCRSQGK